MKTRTLLAVAAFAIVIFGVTSPLLAAGTAPASAEVTSTVTVSSDVQLGYDPFVLSSSFGSQASHCQLFQCLVVDACIDKPNNTPCGSGVPCTCKHCHGVFECFP